jgi:hypothetical protein
MPNTREPAPVPVIADAILKNQMAAVYADADAIPGERHETVPRFQWRWAILLWSCDFRGFAQYRGLM